jgi:hypothetical protein
MNRWMSSHQMPPKIRKKKLRKTEAQINLLELETRKPFALSVQQRTPIIECSAKLRLCESELAWTLDQRKKGGRFSTSRRINKGSIDKAPMFCAQSKAQRSGLELALRALLMVLNQSIQLCPERLLLLNTRESGFSFLFASGFVLYSLARSGNSARTV